MYHRLRNARFPVLALARNSVLPPTNCFFGVDVKFHNAAGRLNLLLDLNNKTALLKNAAYIDLQ